MAESLEWQGNALLAVYDGTTLVDFGEFQKRGGGGLDSEEAKWGPGRMRAEKARGGRPTRENFTLSRPYDPDRDGPLYRRFKDRRGRCRAIVTDLVLDLDGNVAETETGEGIFKAISRGDYDDTSNDPRMFEIEISADA